MHPEPTPSGAHPLSQNRIGDRYELTSPIGRGGMGEVWAGYDQKLDRPVAVKLLRRLDIPEAERDVAVARFMREARVTARLDHPGVPTVHDLGFHGDDIYLVMQLVPGIMLADLVAERGPLPVAWAAAVGAQICAVLATAHAASLVHRDLKPQNLMVTPGGTVKVLDFGVAALLGPAEVSRLTTTGRTLGTPAYIAPEQALNNTVGPQADLYSLGCVLFEMLTGRPPFQAATALEMLHRHIREPAPQVAQHRRGVPAGLGSLIRQLLAKDPADRPASAAEVHDLLVPFAAVERGWSTGPVSDGGWQTGDPTGPYRRPYGPLPLPTSPAGALAKAGAQSGADAALLAATPESTWSSTDELADVADRARELAESDRFTQAAEVLETALRAMGSPDARDSRIIDLRLELADLRVFAGAYRQALPDFISVAEDLAERQGANDQAVWHCRQQIATCQAELGEPSRALATLRALLVDEQRVLPDDAPELFELRQRIAMLRASSGDAAGARGELEGVLAEVRRSQGGHSVAAAAIEGLLTQLADLDRIRG